MLPGVGADFADFSIATIGAELYFENSLPSNFVFVTASEELGGFSCKHAAHDELNTAALMGNWAEVGSLVWLLLRLDCSCLLGCVGRDWFGGPDGWGLELRL